MQQQLKMLEEQNMRILKEQNERRQQANSSGGFGMAPVTAAGSSFVLDPETGMMVPVGSGDDSNNSKMMVRSSKNELQITIPNTIYKGHYSL